jgi:hypothetical protein
MSVDVLEQAMHAVMLAAELVVFCRGVVNDIRRYKDAIYLFSAIGFSRFLAHHAPTAPARLVSWVQRTTSTQRHALPSGFELGPSLSGHIVAHYPTMPM